MGYLQCVFYVMSQTLGRSEYELSYIINGVANYLQQSHLLRNVDKVWLKSDYLRRYSRPIS